jgi:hypothetical protein
MNAINILFKLAILSYFAISTNLAAMAKSADGRITLATAVDYMEPLLLSPQQIGAIKAVDPGVTKIRRYYNSDSSIRKGLTDIERELKLPCSVLVVTDPEGVRKFIAIDPVRRRALWQTPRVKIGFDIETRSRVAVKIKSGDLDGYSSEDFEKEIHITKAVGQHVGQTIRENVKGGSKYYHTQVLAIGQPVSQLTNLLTLRERIHIASQVAAAIIKVNNEKGIFHLDLHFANVHYHRQSGKVTVLDWGNTFEIPTFLSKGGEYYGSLVAEYSAHQLSSLMPSLRDLFKNSKSEGIETPVAKKEFEDLRHCLYQSGVSLDGIVSHLRGVADALANSM